MTDETEDTTKKSGQQRRLEYIHDWQKRLEKQYNELRDKRKEALKFRDADPTIVAIIENRSKITTTDMQDAIDMAKPDILETFAGIDEPLKLDPDNASFVEPVKKLQVLGNVMLKRKNKWFRICSDFLDDSMVLQFGCIKYRWIEEEKVTEKIYEGLEDIELQAMLQREGVSIAEDIPVQEGKKRLTTINYTVTDEYVGLDAVPSERIKFPLDTRDFDQCPMVIEEVRLYKHEFIKTYGIDNFKKVEKTKEALDDAKTDREFKERFKHVGGINHLWDEKSEKYKAYECYFWEDDKAWVMTFAALDIVIQDEKNKYGKPPYRGGSPFLIAHSLIGKGYYDCLKNIQEENTFILRQINDIITQNNFRRNFANVADLGLNIDDYENNSSMDGLVRFEGFMSDQNFRPEDKIPLGADVLGFWEMLNVLKDGHIPTPRAYAGIEGAKDERTYRGKQLKVNQASKKLLMMIRGYGEDVLGPLFQDILDCIAKFMKKKTTVRYLNEDYDIDPNDIICKYALIVNVGLGSHDKQDLIVKLQQLIGLAMQEMQTGIVTPQNLYYMTSELVKAMGFLNTMDFVTDPKLKETIVQFVQMVMMLMKHLAEIEGMTPEMQSMSQHIIQTIQEVMKALGIQPEKGTENMGGQNIMGTQPGDKPAAIPTQMANAFEPQTGITGNGFFA